MRTTVYIISFFSLVIIGLLLWYNKQEMEEMALLSERTVEEVPVHVQRIEPETLDRYFEAPGLLSASTEAVVLSQTQGTVESVPVRLGAQVRRGDVVARVVNDLNQDEVSVNEAAYEKAMKDLERARRLAEGDAITQQQLEGLELQAEAAEIKLKAARKKLSFTAVTAPFSGTVNQVFVKKGGLLGQGSPVIELVDISRLSMQVKVTESYILSVHVGDTASVTVDAQPGHTFVAVVQGIAQKAGPASLYTVELELVQDTGALLKAGMFARAVLTFEDKNPGPVVQRRTIVGSLTAPEVFLVREGMAYKTPVEIDYTYGDSVKIKSGLEEGDLVVTSGQFNLDQGSEVRVVD